jgi:hypothetical protein
MSTLALCLCPPLCAVNRRYAAGGQLLSCPAGAFTEACGAHMARHVARLRSLVLVWMSCAVVAVVTWWLVRAPGLHAPEQLVVPSTNVRECPPEEPLSLWFGFRGKESPWQRGRQYELVVSSDAVMLRCDFSVPLRRKLWAEPGAVSGHGLPVAPDPHQCELFEGSSGEPTGVQVPRRPERVAVRISSEGKVFFHGEAELQAADAEGRCPNALLVPLATADLGGN